MRKKYLEPRIKMLHGTSCNLLSDSGVTGDGNVNVGYGGVDEGGTKDPDAKLFDHHSVWDE